MEQTETQVAQPTMPAGLRIFLYLLANLIGAAVFQLIGILVAGIPISEIANLEEMGVMVHLVFGIWGLVPLIFFTYIFRKHVDCKTILSLGFSLKKCGTDLLYGLITTLLIIGGGSLILNMFGYVNFQFRGINIEILALNFLFFIIVAITEEIMMRGYVLNNLLSVMNRYAALAITSVLFALTHGVNPNLSWLSMLNLFLAGIMLGSAYIFTKNLWFPISLHLFWNFMQGPVLGYNVSGQVTESMFATTTNGNPTISGGEFGFEGSIICSVLTVLLSLGVFVYYEGQKNKNVLAQ